MIRSIRPALVGLALVATAGGTARAQYNYPGGVGYGGYGFGGWSSTPEGGVLRGLGAYAEGEGVYNYDNSVANSVNADTALKLNQYLWNSELDARKRYHAQQAARLNMDKARYQAHQSRLTTDPLQGDIDSGAALNALLHQLTDPKVLAGPALRQADAKVAAASIREIPFRDETDAITLSLDEMTDPKSWPFPLRSDAFKAEREAYQKAIDDALAEDKEGGSLKPETVATVRNAVAVLARKVEATIPKAKTPDYRQATNYVNGLAGLSRMLERPNVETVIAELEKVENTTLGHLIAFMHSYNLRFAPATTPKQLAVYRDLLPVMLAQRDKILGKSNENPSADPAAPAAVDNPTAIFHGMPSSHLYPKPPAAKPAPPAAPAPAPASAPAPAASAGDAPKR